MSAVSVSVLTGAMFTLSQVEPNPATPLHWTRNPAKGKRSRGLQEMTSKTRSVKDTRTGPRQRTVEKDQRRTDVRNNNIIVLTLFYLEHGLPSRNEKYAQELRRRSRRSFGNTCQVGTLSIDTPCCSGASSTAVVKTSSSNFLSLWDGQSYSRSSLFVAVGL